MGLITDSYPMYLKKGKRIYCVLGEIELPVEFELLKTLQIGKGYVYNGQVYIFQGITTKDEIPSFAKGNTMYGIHQEDDESTVIFKKSDVEGDENAYNIEHLKPSDLKSLGEDIPTGNLYDPSMICSINASTSKFVPIVDEENDDFLKKIIKFLIIHTNTDVASFKTVKSEKYWLTNLKQALIGTTKMSTTNFRIWSELIGCDFAIIAYPSKKRKGEKFEPLVYTSEDDIVYKINGVPVINNKEFNNAIDYLQEIYDKSDKVEMRIENRDGIVMKDDDDEPSIDY